ncbi:MAG: hypothetical protein KKA73_22260 [Chloroflexi bacterium]|nr:hypothetical protein [Chloroflexota bacterium]MBU1750417.1 hypothetical protein [Chloroflexota bacterium]
MTEKEELIQAIVNGLIDDITQWVEHDLDSLDVWLRQALRLDRMSEGELRREYDAYLPEEEDDVEEALPGAVCEP